MKRLSATSVATWLIPVAAGGFFPALGLAAGEIVAPPPTDFVQNERPNLPPLPPPPGPAGRTTPAGCAELGPFRSVQVNVTASGLNILGDAANEPSIAVDPNNRNRMAIGWRQFDTVISDFRQAGNGWSSDGGVTWHANTVFTPGIFRSDPVLRSDAAGKFYYNSLGSGFTCDWFTSTNGGQTWQGPLAGGLGGDKLWFAIDLNPGASQNAIHAAWSRNAGCCGSSTFVRFFNNLSLVRGPQSIALSPQFGTVAVGVDSAVYVSGRAGSSIALSKSTNARQSGINTASFTGSIVDLDGSLQFQGYQNPVGLMGQVNVATDRSNGPTRGNVYVLSSVARADGADPLDVMFTRSSDGGTTWSPAIRVNQFNKESDGSFQFFGMIDVAPDGRIDVVWGDTRNDPNPLQSLAQLYYACSFDGGVTWHYDIPVSPVFDTRVGWPVQQKLGDYYDINSDNGGANVAYAATFNGEQDVYFIYISPFDCNNNGLRDVDEIGSGAVLDCNGNDLPDDCEIALGYTADCDGNGVPDDCDIAGGADDCDGNGVPDACQLLADGDCNQNGLLDACELAANPGLDCDADGEFDACEIADGREQDCNKNGRPDDCDIQRVFRAQSNELSPLGFGHVQTFLLTNPPPADGPIALHFSARGDLNTSSETVEVALDSISIGNIFGNGADCSVEPEVDLLVVDSAVFNALATDGSVAISMSPSESVDAGLCTPPGFIRVEIEYSSSAVGSPDQNQNGIPDECESLVGDLNCDGIVSVGDIGPFVLALTDPSGYATSFPGCNIAAGDVNQDGSVTVGDIGPFVVLLSGP